jgi:hypothetical protein
MNDQSTRNEATNIMQSALAFHRVNSDEYITFISHFAPALTGVTFWNKNRMTKPISELLTVTDEAFLLLCLINYSATWKAQELQKSGATEVHVPVSNNIHQIMPCDCNQLQKLTQ